MKKDSLKNQQPNFQLKLTSLRKRKTLDLFKVFLFHSFTEMNCLFFHNYYLFIFSFQFLYIFSILLYSFFLDFLLLGHSLINVVVITATTASAQHNNRIRTLFMLCQFFVLKLPNVFRSFVQSLLSSIPTSFVHGIMLIYWIYDLSEFVCFTIFHIQVQFSYLTICPYF